MISLSTPRLRAIAASALVLAGLASAAYAQAPYPNRTITLVLPFAAGSGTDTTTRIISQHLGIALGVGIVIDNKPGANGMIAATYVARAAPDGYTLFVTTNTTHSANPYLLKTLTYDPVKDFTPIARTGGPGQVENLYTRAMLEEAFGDLALVEIREHDSIIREGSGHNGMSALIDLVARK